MNVPRKVDTLTPRELQVALLLAEDCANKEIAARLNVSAKTVEFHKASIYSRLGVKGVAGITRYLIRKGLLEP